MAILANKLDLQFEHRIEITSRLNNNDTMRNYDSLLAEIKETFNPLMALIEARESKVFGVSAINGYHHMDFNFNFIKLFNYLFIEFLFLELEFWRLWSGW